MPDCTGQQDELALVACLVREPALAEGHTTVISTGAEEFIDLELGALFDQLRAIRDTRPQLTGLGIRYTVETDLHPALDRALAWWDREANQLHPLLPTVAEEVALLARAIHARWRERQIEATFATARHAYRNGEHDQAGEQVVKLGELMSTGDDPVDNINPYTEHTPEVLTAELAELSTGSGLAVHPRLDALLHHRADWRDELVLLGAKTKVGKTRLAGWWISRICASAAHTRPEAQQLVFCTELTRAELLAMLQDYQQPDSPLRQPTPHGRPRLLLFGKEFFARVGGDPPARLRAMKNELRTFAAANLHWAHRHHLAVADCWFAGIVIDYLTSMLAAANDFATCEELVRGLDTSMRIFNPGWVGLDAHRFGELAGLHCNVVVCEQVNARREPPSKITVDQRTGKIHRPPLDPPSPTEINGARSTFETATVYLMLARDPDGRANPPEEAVLRVSGRSVASAEFPLRFHNGTFHLAETSPPATVAAHPTPREHVWTTPPYVLAPPAVLRPDGTLEPSQDRWVPLDPALKNWTPPRLTPNTNGQSLAR
ncbi:hypothetical protein N8J89_16165 [Crossiella sp. CA-258035]|uniref:hypothetical protein n=1 Tax=Crossiella sp. CA-258035 TaxID=2981138 RepID=UPI0024BC0DAF|nr:hypothetical protein [Crossiella sp. CA-258035]WHT22535.1 hypothetical protein N8J89_16165 [Crossiella sp. CA-258035]